MAPPDPSVRRADWRSKIRGAIARLAEHRTWVVLGVWAAVQVVAWNRLGIRLVGDASRYLEGAQALLDGKGLDGAAATFPLMAVAYAVPQAAGLGLVGIVVLQVALSLVAVWRFSAAAEVVYGRTAGLCAGIFLAGWWEIQRRNFFLLTTSLFVSVSALAIAQALLARSWRGRLAAVGLAAVAALVRPDGIVLLGVIAVSAAWPELERRAWTRYAIPLALLGGVVLAAGPVADIAARIRVLDHMVTGTVIWGHDDSRVDVPESLSATAAAPPVTQLEALATHPAATAQVVITRWAYWVAHVKPYYSTRHNAFIVVTYAPLYALAILGLLTPAGRRQVGGLLVGWLALQAVYVGLTFEDWSGRWLLHVLPAVFLLGGAGAARLLGDR